MLFLLDNMFRFDADDGGAGGGGDTPGGGGEGRERLEQRILEAFQGLAQREGGRDAAGIVLLQENRDYRRRIRELEGQVEELQGQLPGDDAVLLQGEEAQQWVAYQELGTPQEIQQQRAQVAALERRQTLAEAAETAGYKVSVLEQLAGDDLAFEVCEEEKDGKASRVAYVMAGEGEATPLSTYAEEHWGDFMPALAAEQGAGQRQQRTFVSQATAGDAPTGPAKVEDIANRKRAQYSGAL